MTSNKNFPLLIMFTILCVSCSIQPGRVLTEFTTDPNRTKTVGRVCKGTSRSQLFQMSEQIDRSYAQETIANVFKDFDSVAFIQDLFNQNVDSGRIGKEVQENAGSIVVAFGFFVIPLVVMIFLLPALCCCCCCPDTCPLCCRQPKGQQYQDHQRAFPAFCIIVFCLFIIAAGITGMVWRQSIQNTYDHTRCSVAIMFDDVLNGNVTFDGNNFFIGIQTLGQQIQLLSDNIGQIQSQIDKVSSDGAITSKVLSDLDTALQDVSNIPDGAGGALVLEYASPLNEASTGATISSTFPAELGTDSNGTLIHEEYQALQAAKLQVTGVSLAADAFEASIAAFQDGFSQAINQVNNVADGVDSVDSQVDITFQNVQDNVVDIIVIFFYLIMGILVFFSVLTLLAAFFLLCCGKSSCRYLLYTGCVCLSLMGFVCFAMATFFALLAPVSYFGCDFIETSLQSKRGFKNNLGPVINDEQVTDILAECLPSESGNVIQKLVGGDVYATITSLDETLSELADFDGATTADDLNAGYSQVTPRIGMYMRAQVIDIDINADQSLTKISNASEYSTCLALGFDEDSWIPSVTSQTQVPCLVSGDDATNTTCTSTSDFQTRASGCVGCMDSYLILEGNTTRTDVQASLIARYPTCTTFSQELSHIWQNFYFVKETEIGAVFQRSKDADLLIEDIENQIRNDVDTLFSDTLQSLRDEFSTIVDPKYGFIAGLNCKPITEDVQLFFTTFCNDAIIMSVFMQIAFAVIGWFIMLIACCSVCLGVRHLRKSEQENREQYYVGGYPPQSAEGFKE